MVDAAADGVVAFGGRDEIARDDSRALVDELVEGVLAVGARLAPYYWPGVEVDLEKL